MDGNAHQYAPPCSLAQSAYRACQCVAGLTADKGPEVDAKLFDFIVRQDLAVSTSLFDLKLRVHVLVDVSQPFDAAHKAVRGWSETTWGNVNLVGGGAAGRKHPSSKSVLPASWSGQKKTARKCDLGAGPPLVAQAPSRVGRAKFPTHTRKLGVRHPLLSFTARCDARHPDATAHAAVLTNVKTSRSLQPSYSVRSPTLLITQAP